MKERIGDFTHGSLENIRYEGDPTYRAWDMKRVAELLDNRLDIRHGGRIWVFYFGKAPVYVTPDGRQYPTTLVCNYEDSEVTFAQKPNTTLDLRDVVSVTADAEWVYVDTGTHGVRTHFQVNPMGVFIYRGDTSAVLRATQPQPRRVS